MRNEFFKVQEWLHEYDPIREFNTFTAAASRLEMNIRRTLGDATVGQNAIVTEFTPESSFVLRILARDSSRAVVKLTRFQPNSPFMRLTGTPFSVTIRCDSAPLELMLGRVLRKNYRRDANDLEAVAERFRSVGQAQAGGGGALGRRPRYPD